MADGRVVIDVKVTKNELQELETSIHNLELNLERLGSKNYLQEITNSLDSLNESLQESAAYARHVSESFDGLGVATSSLGTVEQKVTALEQAMWTLDSTTVRAGDSSVQAIEAMISPISTLEGMFALFRARIEETTDQVQLFGHNLESVIGIGSGIEPLGHNIEFIEQAFIRTASSVGLLQEEMQLLLPSTNYLDQIAGGADGIAQAFSEAKDAAADSTHTVRFFKETADDALLTDDRYVYSQDEIAQMLDNTFRSTRFDSFQQKQEEMLEKFENMGKSTFGESLAKQFTIATLAASGIEKIIQIITKFMGAGIKRFDVFYQFPRVMAHLGTESNVAADAISRLEARVIGLPTSLDEITAESRKFAVLSGDVEEAADLTLALNDALLASGSSTYDASRGMRQYYRMLSSGLVHQRSWRTLTETMPVALQRVAEAFGYAGETAVSDFYNGLQSGKHTMQDFNDQLIIINSSTENFHDMALDSSRGINTSITNMKIAVTRGLGNILADINNFLEEVTGKDMIAWLDTMKIGIDNFFKGFSKAVEILQPAAKLIYDFKEELGILLAIFIARNSHKEIFNFFKNMTQGIEFMSIKAEMFAETWKSTANQGMKLGERLRTSLNSETGKIFDGAAGLITKIGLTVLATKVLIDLISKTPFMKRIIEQSKEFAASVDETIGKLKGLREEGQAIEDLYKTNTRSIERNHDATLELISDIEYLSGVENKSAAQKKELREAIDEVNRLLGEQVYKYDEVAEAAVGNNELINELTLEMYHTELANSLEKEKQDWQDHYDQLLTDREKAKEKLNEVDLVLDESGPGSLDLRDRDIGSETFSEMIQRMKEEWAKLKDYEGPISLLDFWKLRDDRDELAAELDGIDQDIAKTGNTIDEVGDKIQKNSKLAADATNRIAEITADKSFSITQSLKEVGKELGIEDVRFEMMVAASEKGGEQLVRAAEQVAKRTIASWQDLDKEEEEIVRSMQGHYTDLYMAATDAFNKIEMETDVTAQSILENMQHNLNAVSGWVENMETLGNRVLEDGSRVNADFVDLMRNLGPDYAAEVAVLVGMTDAELQELNRMMEESGATAIDGLTKAFGYDTSDMPDTIESLVTDIYEDFNAKSKAVDWEVHGEDIVQGLAKGIVDNADAVLDTTGKIPLDMERIFKEAAGIQSPSKMFARLGKFIMDGIQEGLKRGESTVLRGAKLFVRNLQQELSDGFNRINRIIAGLASNIASTASGRLGTGVSRAFSSGYNTGMGFYNGLSSTANSIYNLANRIANNVANTMRRSLKQRSPSRVTREIGAFAGEGFVLGLEDWIIGSELAGERLSNSMLSGLEANSMFNLSNRALASSYGGSLGSGSVINNSESYQPIINIEKIEWTGKEDILRTMDQIGFVLGQEKWRMK